MELFLGFLAFLALIVACMTLFIQRQHNRKALLPIIHTYFSASVSDGWVTREFKLLNDGNGVAILKSIQLHLENGEEIKITNYNDFTKIIQERNPHSKDIVTSLPFCLRANSTEIFYGYRLQESATDALDNSTATVTSESIYGDIVIANESGFEVISNKRDAVFESIFSKLADKTVSLFNKATNKSLNVDA